MPRPRCGSRSADNVDNWRYAVEQYRIKRQEATRRGLPFDLTARDIFYLLNDATHCPVLNIPLQRRPGRGGSPDTPSLDRVEPELGYVQGNVRVISWRANKLKGDATLEELRALVAYVSRHVRKRQRAASRTIKASPG